MMGNWTADINCKNNFNIQIYKVYNTNIKTYEKYININTEYCGISIPRPVLLVEAIEIQVRAPAGLPNNEKVAEALNPLTKNTYAGGLGLG